MIPWPLCKGLPEEIERRVRAVLHQLMKRSNYRLMAKALNGVKPS